MTQAHGSSCTEAFFRSHVERETRLREGEELEWGSRGGNGGDGSGNGKGPKEGRRAEMVEVLRRIRHGRGRGMAGAQPAVASSGGAEHEDGVGGGGGGEPGIQQERLEVLALALALKERGHAIRTRPAAVAADEDARDAGAAGNAYDPPGRASGTFTRPSVSARGSRSATAPASNCRRRGDGAAEAGVRSRFEQLEPAEDCGRQERAQWEEERGRERQILHESEEQLEQNLALALDSEQQPQPQQYQQHQLPADDEGVLDLLTEEERMRFLREVASGRLGKLIVPWVPWWTHAAGVQEVTTMPAGGRTSHSLPPAVVDLCRETICSLGGSGAARHGYGRVASPPMCPLPPEQRQDQQERQQEPSPTGPELSSSSSSSSSSMGEGGRDRESACTRHSFAALLSQSSQTPAFSSISARPPSSTLPALATDLVYAYVFSARLYNGCWCSDPVGASLALVGASPVLGDGATPETAGQALAACVDRAVAGEEGHMRGYAESLREDVKLVCGDPRKLLCAFQDAWGMLEAAGRTLAPAIKQPGCNTAAAAAAAANRTGGGGKYKKAQRRAAKELGKVEKRIGYFLLWARSHGVEAAPCMLAAVLEASPPSPPRGVSIRRRPLVI